MTNLNYIRTLNSEKLAELIVEEPWRDYTNDRYLNYRIPYMQGIEEWLEMECNNG